MLYSACSFSTLMKILLWTNCNVNYINMSFWHFLSQHSIFILQVCVLFGENERNIQEGPRPGKILKRPQSTHKELCLHSSLCFVHLGGFCPCTVWNTAGCGTERARIGWSCQKPGEVWVSLEWWKDFAMCSCLHDAAHDVGGNGHTGLSWETSCPCLCVWYSPL